MHLLTINTGSSSLKVALYAMDGGERRRVAAEAERIGRDGSRLRMSDAAGAVVLDREESLPDHAAALRKVFDWLEQQGIGQDLAAVGHRIVHGGERHRAPERVTPALLDDLRALLPVDPEHLPQAIGAVEAVEKLRPGIPQVACFDTAFHRDMPRVATIYGLPRPLLDAGVIRYGFHGLSYEYILDNLRREDPVAARGRLVIAHLGNGASMVAVRNGVGQDTTMGFSPTGGLVMSTRTGDLDPGVLLYLLQAKGMAPADANRLVNKEAGLLGVSATSSDMRDLLDREARDPRAAEAIALFCYQIRKFLGAFAVVLGGLDTLVFTGGIGERAATIRARVCADLEFLGIRLDPARNAAHTPIISPDTQPSGAVTVRVMKTDEDLMIARHAYRLLASQRVEREEQNRV